jgi:hypothetical protein
MAAIRGENHKAMKKLLLRRGWRVGKGSSRCQNRKMKNEKGKKNYLEEK